MKRLALALTLTLAPQASEANDMHLVPKINAALRKWVRPVACTSGTPTLTTYYNSGRRTANGEAFNPGGLTAAHRSLPFGTILHVSNPRTGASTSVRINDRGPFTIASLDLAQGAARAIGMHTSLYLCVTGIRSAPIVQTVSARVKRGTKTLEEVKVAPRLVVHP